MPGFTRFRSLLPATRKSLSSPLFRWLLLGGLASLLACHLDGSKRCTTDEQCDWAGLRCINGFCRSQEGYKEKQKEAPTESTSQEEPPSEVPRPDETTREPPAPDETPSEPTPEELSTPEEPIPTEEVSPTEPPAEKQIEPPTDLPVEKTREKTPEKSPEPSPEEPLSPDGGEPAPEEQPPEPTPEERAHPEPTPEPVPEPIAEEPMPEPAPEELTPEAAPEPTPEEPTPEATPDGPTCPASPLKISLTSGTLNKKSLSLSAPEITLQTGEKLSGSLSVRYTSTKNPGDVSPFCATPTWGNHQSSGWTIRSSVPRGNHSLTVPINLTVPTSPGTQYLFLASALELNCGDVLSATHWRDSSTDRWNDSDDLASWGQKQYKQALQCQAVQAAQYRNRFVAWGAAAVKINVVCPYSSIQIALTGGTLNNQSISPTNPQITASKNTTLSGSLSVRYTSTKNPGDVSPFCATPTWGNHQSSGWTIRSSVPRGNHSLTVPINLTTPSTPGTYFIFLASALELNCGDVLSATHWQDSSTDRWNDSDDLASWGQTHFEQTLSCKRVAAPMYSNRISYWGAAAVKIIVK